LILEEALRLFHGCLLLHQNNMHRLIICLKLIFDLPVERFEIENLINIQKREIDKSEILNLMALAGNGDARTIHDRFELYRQTFNRCDQSQTDAASYWRWTNMQIEKMIKLINEKHLMAFDRETFAILAENYFSRNYQNGFLK
jgi:hypothetical protein